MINVLPLYREAYLFQAILWRRFLRLRLGFKSDNMSLFKNWKSLVWGLDKHGVTINKSSNYERLVLINVLKFFVTYSRSLGGKRSKALLWIYDKFWHLIITYFLSFTTGQIFKSVKFTETKTEDTCRVMFWSINLKYARHPRKSDQNGKTQGCDSAMAPFSSE